MSKELTTGQARLFRVMGLTFSVLGLGLLVFELWRGATSVLLYVTDGSMVVAGLGLYAIGRNAGTDDADRR